MWLNLNERETWIGMIMNIRYIYLSCKLNSFIFLLYFVKTLQTLNKQYKRTTNFYLYSCLTELPVIRNTMIKQSVLTVFSCYHTFVLVAEFR